MSETKDIITMAHGSGGQASHELMSRVFGKYFHNDILEVGCYSVHLLQSFS